MPENGFSVAFSFAGEQRLMVREIAHECEALLGRGKVFFDEWFEHVIGGFDADMFLQRVYGRQTQMTVIGVSGQYDRKPWTQVEYRAIRSRLNELTASGDARDRLRFLPIRVGDGELEGTFPTLDIALEARGRSAAAMAQIITSRLAQIDAALVPPPAPRATVLVLPCLGSLAALSGNLTSWLESQNIAVLRPNVDLPLAERTEFAAAALAASSVVVEWFQSSTQVADEAILTCHDEIIQLNAALAQRRPTLMWLPPDGGQAAGSTMEGTSGKRMLFEQFKKTVLETALAPPIHGARKVVISAARADQEAVRRLIERLPPSRPRDAQYDELHQPPDYKTMPDLDERLLKAIRRRTGCLVVVNGVCSPRWLEDRLRAFDHFREDMPQAPRLVVWDVPQAQAKPPLDFLPDETVTVTSADPAPVAAEISRNTAVIGGGA